MDPNSIEERYAARLITQLESVLARAVGQERQRWAEPFQELQKKISELQSENVRLNIQIQSHQLESTNRALWHKRKAESDALDNRPTKLPRQQDLPLQGFAPPTPNSSRALSADTDDEVEGSHPQRPPDLVQSTRRTNGSDATRAPPSRRPRRPIAPLPRRARGSDVPLPGEPENEMERAVYCLCGGHEYGLMIHCDNPRCELVWFHAGCVGLKEVPDEEEEWFCTACTGSVNEVSAPSRRFATIAVQTADSTRIDSGCQTISESQTRISPPPIDPQKPSLAIRPLKPPHLLSPFVPQSSSATILSRPGTPPLVAADVSPGSTLTPLSMAGPQTPANCEPETFVGSSRGKDAVVIHVPKKLINSSRQSLFRMLQPTARKPWADDSDSS